MHKSMYRWTIITLRIRRGLFDRLRNRERPSLPPPQKILFVDLRIVYRLKLIYERKVLSSSLPEKMSNRYVVGIR